VLHISYNAVQLVGIKVKIFRLLTKKSGSSKGCGFMELKSSKQLQVTMVVMLGCILMCIHTFMKFLPGKFKAPL